MPVTNTIEYLSLFLLREEQTAAYSIEIWKQFRKWGGAPTGITQNVKDLLSSREVENIFENSDFILMPTMPKRRRQFRRSWKSSRPRKKPKRQPKKLKRSKFLGVITLVGLAAGGGFYFFIQKKKKEQAAKESVDPDADYRECEEELELPLEEEPVDEPSEESKRKAYQISDGYEDV